MNVRQNQSGFIALISAIVMSLILVTITVILNLTGFFGRYNIVDSEFKQVSAGRAEACVDIAILKINQNPYYSPTNESVVMGSNACTIVSVLLSGSRYTIKTQGEYKNSYTNLEILYSTLTSEIESWEECPTTCP